MPKKKPALMLQGTASSVGKSLLTAAFCRIFRQDGFRVSPFKAQNMSNNSWVTIAGEEIARSQVVQAQAAGVEPDARMNPILLKPLSDRSSQVVYLGAALGSCDFRSYSSRHDEYYAKVCQCYDSLASEYDVVVLEGAGSSAEVNLKSRDLVNMKMAKHADASVVIVGDIDRGGVFASFVGMMAIFEHWEKKLVSGFIVNRFRGDPSLLEGALEYIDETTGVSVLGVVPMIPDLTFPEEDGVQFSENSFDDRSPLGERIDIALIGLARVSNYNDLDPLRFEKDVRLRIVRKAEDLGVPDVVIIPGTRNVIEDMELLEQSGLKDVIVYAAQEQGAEVVGICGGLQMLGKEIRDPHQIESSGRVVAGLGILDLTTELEKEKKLRREKAFHQLSSLSVQGYRIHHGATKACNAEPAITTEDGEVIGYQSSALSVWGSYLHGVFDDDNFRRWFVDRVRLKKGLPALGKPTFIYSLESEFDRLANEVRAAVDIPKVCEFLDLA